MRKVAVPRSVVRRSGPPAAVLLILGSLLAGAGSPAAASSPKPVISGFSATPASVPWTGGPVTLSAGVTNASQCTFSATAGAVSGLPTTVACGSGTASAIVTVRVNPSTSPRTDRFTLTALGTARQATARTTVRVGPAPPRPRVTSFVTDPTPVPWTGGAVTLSAGVTNALQCTFSVSATAVSGLPTTVACGSGTASAIATVAPNPTTRTKRFGIRLTVTGARSSTVQRELLTLEPAPAPVIAAYRASPSPVSWTGGTATLSGTVAHATTCTFSAQGKARRAVSGLPATVPCSSGSPSVTVTLAANRTSRTKNYTVVLTARGSGARVITRTTVAVSPDTTPPSVSSFTSSPSPVGSGGGPVTLSATVADALTCTFSSKKAAVSGLPVTKPCSVGTVSVVVTVPATTGRGQRSYPVELVVRGRHHKKVLATDFITVAGT